MRTGSKPGLAGLLCLCLIFPLRIYGQEEHVDVPVVIADTQDFKTGLFDSDELLKIHLSFDITYYKRKKPVEENLDALLTYYASETDTIQKKIKLRARGNFRRTFCDFPPLRLNFNINDSADGVFGGIDKLKVVPHCRGGFEIYILKEYLIYKLYNALTDYSLRVRLMEISYFNTSRNSKPIKEYGFAIEPIELFEKRTGLMEYNSTNLSQRNIKPDIMDLVAIFNYMIGNTDWSVPNQHNVQTFSQYESHYLSSGTLVPYDFDHAGLVNTFYAHPYKDLPIESVLDRYYLGMCRNDEDLIQSIKVFAGKKSEFYRIINEFPYLNAASKKEMINYLNSFFVKFDKRNTIVYEMLKSCQNL